jgi:hypothetical protein
MKWGKPSVVMHSCNPSYSGGRGRKIPSSSPARPKLVRPYLTTGREGGRKEGRKEGNTSKRAGGMA